MILFPFSTQSCPCEAYCDIPSSVQNYTVSLKALHHLRLLVSVSRQASLVASPLTTLPVEPITPTPFPRAGRRWTRVLSSVPLAVPVAPSCHHVKGELSPLTQVIFCHVFPSSSRRMKVPGRLRSNQCLRWLRIPE